MKVPIYTSEHLNVQPGEAPENIEDFSGFISNLIEMNVLDNSTEKGVVALVQDKGTQDLTVPQLAVIQRIVDRYVDIECSLCGDDTPWSERVDIEQTGGMCCYHQERQDNYMAKD